ncbi:MAG TPA: putative colanic acid biosynthesis acetyltransferase [Sphingopyxis sp.]|nr:putative colanic acid biosynthesis acetyltransferase [Sphingopyxis sp.]
MRPAVIPHPSLGDKLRRAIWNAAWLLLYRPSPIPLHGWRRFLLRRFGADVGARARPYPSARIWAPWNFAMGEGSTVGPRSEVYCVARVTLGPWSVVSQRAYLCTASHDIHAPGFALTAAPIAIGRNAWVAADAFVGPGVTLAEGAVAAARAVVVKDVERNVIVGGNPAGPIGACALADFADGSMRPGG